MSDIDNNNISQLSVNEAIVQLSKMYNAVIKGGLKFSDVPSVMLWGPPGVGKSQLVRQLAKDIEKESSKKVNITDVRLLLFNPIDLRGIPTANEDKTLAVWLKPQIFQMDSSNKVVNILFLDEISAAPQSVQAAAYQIVLDRVIGEHKLPDNCIVMAAGNRITDKSVAYTMPRALANRLCHIEIMCKSDSWHQWAVKSGINEKVLAYISYDHTTLLNDNNKDNLAYATPRSWEMVSNILNNVDGNIETVYPLIVGCIGRGAAVQFSAWCKVFKQMPSIEDIFNGKNVAAPTGPDLIYAIVSAMTTYANKHQTKIDKIVNSIAFAAKLPADFQVILLMNYQAIGKEFYDKFKYTQEGLNWINKISKYVK